MGKIEARVIGNSTFMNQYQSEIYNMHTVKSEINYYKEKL